MQALRSRAGVPVPAQQQRRCCPFAPAPSPSTRVQHGSTLLGSRRCAVFTQHSSAASSSYGPSLPLLPRRSPGDAVAGLASRPRTVAAAGGASLASSSDSPAPSYPRDFVLRRLLVFVCIVLGYSSYYLTRNSLTYTAPVMVADPLLHMDITQIGAMTSIFPIAYGMSKFVSGVLGARLSPSVLLGGGLMATALINVAFGFGTSLAWFCFFWGLNGTLQGVGGPACARILTNWFASKERGTYWGMWNIAHNLGGFAAPIIAGGFAKSMGWKWGMWAPGIIGVVVGAAVLLLCRDRPEDIGYPPVEPVNDPPPAAATARNANSASSSSSSSLGGGSGGTTSSSGAQEQPAAAAAPAKKLSLWEGLVKAVLRNPFIWGMALTYFFIYVIRQGVTSWFVFYLLKAKGVEDAAAAAVRVSGLELGGLVGSLIAGKLSDYLISRSKDKTAEGNVGKRVRVVMGYTVGIAAAISCFQYVPATQPALQWANVFMIGFFLYGPQMLIGLCGAELVGPDSVGASEGFLGWVAYLGAANAGIPLSIIVKQYGWDAYFGTLVGACGMALLLLAPMANLRSYVQRKALLQMRMKAA